MGSRLNDINDFENYLLTLSRNKYIELIRRTNLENSRMQAITDDWDQPTNLTEEQILLNDTRKILNEAVSLLPPQQKQVYQLCQVDGMPQKQVAELMNLSPETVKRYMKLALKFLHQHISTHTDVAAIFIILKML
ncbi:MAG: sigma-70 family RNA polymerase sigma factor [Bacteroidota bacterium]